MSLRQEIMGDWHGAEPVTIRAALRSAEDALAEQASAATERGRRLGISPLAGESLVAFEQRLDAMTPRADAAPGPSVARFG